MPSTYLTHTHGSAGTLSTKGTFSCWIKRSAVAGEQVIFTGNDGSNRDFVRFESSSILRTRGCAGAWDLQTTQVFMDVNAWYHILVSVDTTQSTDSNRVKVYVNGSQITSFGTATYPSQNYALLGWSGNGKLQTLGRDGTNNAGYFDGTLSHVHWIDGTAYDASAFGSVDSVTGEWSINTSPSVTYGTNGFFVLKDGNSVTDQSGNSNNFTVAGGTLTKTEDCPDNLFANGNPLSAGTNLAFSNGNNQIRNDTSTFNSALGTLAFGTGKYYFEAYRHGGGGTANVGITLSSKFGGNHSGVDAGRIMYSSNGNIYKEAWSGLSNVSGVATLSDTDIVGVSIDTENGILKFYRNGVLIDTTTNSLLLSSNNEFIPAFAFHNGGEFRLNFGNGYFGSTQISSEGTNASGIGKFEYDVQPTDATALSTKGLNL